MQFDWKDLLKNKYTKTAENDCIVYSTSDVDFSFIENFSESSLFFKISQFKSSYTHFSISKKSKVAIDMFSAEHDLNALDLYGLAAAFQANYIELLSNRLAYTMHCKITDVKKCRITEGECCGAEDIVSWYDAQYFYKEKELFLSLIEEYFHFKTMEDKSERIERLKKPSDLMTLKMSTKIYKFKNFQIINDWLYIYTAFHSLTPENFSDFKMKQLAEISNINFEKYPEFFLQNGIWLIFSLITAKSPKLTKNTRIKHAAYFHLVTQIPINSRAVEIEFPTSLIDLSPSDTNNTNAYLKGLKALSVK
jgi:hypothetical protein